MDQPSPPDYTPTALPSLAARILAFLAILLGGLFGGLIGYGFTDLQCTDGCTTAAAGVGVLGAVIGAAGVGVVAVLALRAMGEWREVQVRDDAK